jgi:DNA-binding NarL/FixJ family response regulator
MDLDGNAAFCQKRLSERELAIIALIGEGRTNNAIAVQLGIAPETIKTYLKRIFVKLGPTRAQRLWFWRKDLRTALQQLDLRRG